MEYLTIGTVKDAAPAIYPTGGINIPWLAIWNDQPKRQGKRTISAQNSQRYFGAPMGGLYAIDTSVKNLFGRMAPKECPKAIALLN